MYKKLFLIVFVFLLLTIISGAQQKKLLQFSVTTGFDNSSNSQHKLHLITGQTGSGLSSSPKYKVLFGLLEGDRLISGVNDNNTDLPNPLVSVSPNPAFEKITVTTGFPLNGTSAEIYDLTGRIVMNRLLIDCGFNFEVDISGLASGTYNLALSTGSLTYIRQFAVVR